MSGISSVILRTAMTSVRKLDTRNQINKILSDAKILCDKGQWEAALILYRKGLQLRPHSMACRAGEQRASYVIKNLLEEKPSTENYNSSNGNVQSAVPTNGVYDCEKIFTKTDNPEFKELCKDLHFIKKAKQSEYFPKDGHFEKMLNHLDCILTAKKPLNKTGIPIRAQQTSETTEMKEKSADENWKEALEYLESINDPSQLLLTAMMHSKTLERMNHPQHKSQILGEIYYLIMKAYVDLCNYEDADLYKGYIMKIVEDTHDDELRIRACYLEGRAYALKGNYTAAAKTWQDLLKKTTNPDRMAHLLHEVGRCFFKLGRLESARAYGILSHEAASEAKNDVWLKNASLLVAQIEALRGNKSEALERYGVAEAAARRLDDQRTLIYIICEVQKLGKKPRRPKTAHAVFSTARNQVPPPGTLRRPKLLPNNFISV